MEENIMDLVSNVFVSRHYPGTSLSVRKNHTEERLKTKMSPG
jgi:hypothetical protein